MSKFKDSSNRWLTTGLFYGLRDYDLKFAKFCLDEEDRVVDGKSLLSIKKLYMSCTDPTEYEFATKHLGGWAHWKALQETNLLIPYIAAWRDELEVKLRAESIKQIASLAKTEKGYQAARYIADCGWKIRAAGAPSKAEKEGFKKQQERVDNVIALDAERLGITRIK
jgi:hypothetical protein